MKKIFLISILLFFMAVSVRSSFAKVTPTASPSATLTPVITETPYPTLIPRTDLTQKTEEIVEPLRRILNDQKLGTVFPSNFLKYAIRGSVNAGVPPNTIVLLLLLPGVAGLIAAVRQLVGLRGFGIFLPAALSVVFVAVGPIVGIGLFLLIVAVSTITRLILRKLPLIFFSQKLSIIETLLLYVPKKINLYLFAFRYLHILLTGLSAK